MGTDDKGKIKYLHVMTDTNFVVTGTFAAMIDRHFDPKEHLFLVNHREFYAPEYMKALPNVIIGENMGFSASGIGFLVSYLKRAEHIIWHSFGWHWVLQFRLLFAKNIAEKSTWVIWGGDMYGYKHPRAGFPRNIYNKITDGIMTAWRRKVRSAVVIFPKDRDFASEILNTRAEIYESRYTTFSSDDLDRVKPEDHEGFNILLGHFAAKCLNHEEILEKISKFKDKNIKIYIPLSYGDTEYAKTVSEKAKNIFGGKAVILDKFMSPDDYSRLLWQMDAAIFHTDRQIGLGNICRLLYMGCKIYTQDGGVLAKELKTHDCTTFDSFGIGEMSFEDFTAKEGIVPSEWAKDSMNEKKTAEMWQKVFRNLENPEEKKR